MAGVLARHDKLVREAISRGGGHVFKHLGDGMCAAFSSAPDAVAAAEAVIRALEAEPWPDGRVLRVRVGLHTGSGSPAGWGLFRACGESCGSGDERSETVVRWCARRRRRDSVRTRCSAMRVGTRWPGLVPSSCSCSTVSARAPICRCARHPRCGRTSRWTRRASWAVRSRSPSWLRESRRAGW